MQENQLFEYAVIRVVPRVEREEFLNIGVILYSASTKYLQCIIDINEPRIIRLYKDIDMGVLHEHVQSFKKICEGGKNAGPIGLLSPAERFRWLTATRSTILQTSKVHPGLCHEPDTLLKRLHQQLVLAE